MTRSHRDTYMVRACVRARPRRHRDSIGLRNGLSKSSRGPAVSRSHLSRDLFVSVARSRGRGSRVKLTTGSLSLSLSLARCSTGQRLIAVSERHAKVRETNGCRNVPL